MINSRLAYSTNPTLNQKCPKCKESVSECVCLDDTPIDSNKITAVLRIETSGRNGKTVTVIDRLPKAESFLKELCTELKKKCGSGGTYFVREFGVVEIQGDKREVIRKILLMKSLIVKG